MIGVLVHGARGRMGQRVCALLRADERFEIVAALGRSGAAKDGADTWSGADVAIDFSAPRGTDHAAQQAAHAGVPLVVGTTGLTHENLQRLDESARSIPVLVAPNLALGAVLLHHLAATAARLLGSGYDVDIVESHRAGKRDQPSGTALSIATAIEAARGTAIPAHRVHSIRSGELPGEHRILFSGPHEFLEITHRAGDRDLYAEGALRAAAWLVEQPPGRYRVEDALGVSSLAGGG